MALVMPTWSDDIKNKLDALGNMASVLVFIRINGDLNASSHLSAEESWLQEFDYKLKMNCFPTLECRVLWDTVFYAFSGQELHSLDKNISYLIREMSVPDMENVCIIKVVNGNIDEKIMALEQLNEETSSPFDLGKTHGVYARWVQGVRI